MNPLPQFPIAAQHVRPHTWLAQSSKTFLGLCECRARHLFNGRTIDDRLDIVLRVIYFVRLLPTNLAWLVVFSSPVLFEVPLTTARPRTMRERAEDRMRKVRLEVPVSLLYAGKFVPADIALRGGFVELGVDFELVLRWRVGP